MFYFTADFNLSCITNSLNDMMKIKTLLILALMLITIGCQKTPTINQAMEQMGREKMKKIEKEGFPRFQKQIINNLKYPESYEAISTDMSIVTSNMILHNSRMFVTLRDLERTTRNYKEEFGNDTTSQEARNELEAIHFLTEEALEKASIISNSPIDFEGIEVYHQFYANDRPNHKAKKGYHIIFHKDNRTTLLCDHDEFLRIKAFAKELLKDTPYGID